MIEKQQGVRWQFTDLIRRKIELVEIAVELAREHGYQSVSRSQIAGAAGISPSLVNKYLGSGDLIETLIVDYAIVTRNRAVVAQAIAHRHPLTRTIPKELKDATLKAMV